MRFAKLQIILLIKKLYSKNNNTYSQQATAKLVTKFEE